MGGLSDALAIVVSFVTQMVWRFSPRGMISSSLWPVSTASPWLRAVARAAVAAATRRRRILFFIANEDKICWTFKVLFDQCLLKPP